MRRLAHAQSQRSLQRRQLQAPDKAKTMPRTYLTTQGETWWMTTSVKMNDSISHLPVTARAPSASQSKRPVRISLLCDSASI